MFNEDEIDKDLLVTLTEYKKLVSEVGVKDNFLRPGAFYSCFYNFIPNNKDTKYDIKRWYDFFPLIYVIDRWETKDGNIIITGINFHHIPRALRTEWFENMKKSYGDISETKSRYILIPPNQLLLKQRKLYYTIRNYSIEDMILPMRIPFEYIQEVADINSMTHLGVGPIGISNRMRSKRNPTKTINIRKKR